MVPTTWTVAPMSGIPESSETVPEIFLVFWVNASVGQSSIAASRIHMQRHRICTFPTFCRRVGTGECDAIEWGIHAMSLGSVILRDFSVG